MAKVTIIRKKSLILEASTFKVWSDGKEVGTVAAEATTSFDLQPGTRTLQVGVGVNAGISPKKAIMITKGQNTLEVGIDPKFYICMGLLILALLCANSIGTVITNKAVYFIGYLVVFLGLAGIMARNTIYIKKVQ